MVEKRDVTYPLLFCAGDPVVVDETLDGKVVATYRAEGDWRYLVETAQGTLWFRKERLCRVQVGERREVE